MSTTTHVYLRPMLLHWLAILYLHLLLRHQFGVWLLTWPASLIVSTIMFVPMLLTGICEHCFNPTIYGTLMCSAYSQALLKSAIISLQPPHLLPVAKYRLLTSDATSITSYVSSAFILMSCCSSMLSITTNAFSATLPISSTSLGHAMLASSPCGSLNFGPRLMALLSMFGSQMISLVIVSTPFSMSSTALNFHLLMVFVYWSSSWSFWWWMF